MEHVLRMVGMQHTEVSSCFLYSRGKGHGEGVVGMVHALVRCVCYVCVGRHLFYWWHACIHTYICCACSKESDLKRVDGITHMCAWKSAVNCKGGHE